MTKMLSENPKVSLQDIKQFEQECDVTLPKQYVDFLLEYNGGFPQESSFKISDDEGESYI
ncbi:SMI1/KNR4 family protein [Bacillus pseudomycoides]|uniref:SMI1/KNR4 family protein n=1 Tax=Bacillus pseudomycoides TaxID=64104 RepID=UPI0020D22193|nr:SMI1/KNR4 family protein [Bacillus pseudomycoides]